MGAPTPKLVLPFKIFQTLHENEFESPGDPPMTLTDQVSSQNVNIVYETLIWTVYNIQLIIYRPFVSIRRA